MNRSGNFVNAAPNPYVQNQYVQNQQQQQMVPGGGGAAVAAYYLRLEQRRVDTDNTSSSTSCGRDVSYTSSGKMR